jgi:predicted nucleic acid-binding protein
MTRTKRTKRTAGPRSKRRITHLVLDAEGLHQAAVVGSRLHDRIHATREAGKEVRVSAVTLTEVLRGDPRDARVHAVLEQCHVLSVTDEVGRAAGELLGRTGRNDAVDALVAVTAADAPKPVELITSDPKDLIALTEEMAGVAVQAV